MSLLSGLLGSATPWGALIGGIFGTAKKWLDDRKELKLKKLQFEENKLERKHDLDLADKEIKKVEIQGNLELEEEMFKTDREGLTRTVESQDSEISALKSVLEKSHRFIQSFVAILFSGVTVVQKLMRPVLTAALFVLTCKLFYEVNLLVGGLNSLDQNELLKIYTRIIITCLNLTEAAVMFWFTTRPGKKDGVK